MSGFDWPVLLRAGVTGLRLRPAEFWALTPAELRLMLGQEQGGAALSRSGLDELMARWPDQGESDADD